MTRPTLSLTSPSCAERATDAERGTRLGRRASAFAALGADGLGLAGFLSCNCGQNSPGTAAHLESLIADASSSTHDLPTTSTQEVRTRTRVGDWTRDLADIHRRAMTQLMLPASGSSPRS